MLVKFEDAMAAEQRSLLGGYRVLKLIEVLALSTMVSSTHGRASFGLPPTLATLALFTQCVDSSYCLMIEFLYPLTKNIP